MVARGCDSYTRRPNLPIQITTARRRLASPRATAEPPGGFDMGTLEAFVCRCGTLAVRWPDLHNRMCGTCSNDEHRLTGRSSRRGGSVVGDHGGDGEVDLRR